MRDIFPGEGFAIENSSIRVPFFFFPFFLFFVQFRVFSIIPSSSFLKSLSYRDVDVQLKEEWLVKRETHNDSTTLYNFFKLLEGTKKLTHQSHGSYFSNG